MSAWDAPSWRHSPLAAAIVAREGHGLSRVGGTPRHPRTLARDLRKATAHRGHRATPLTRRIDGHAVPRRPGYVPARPRGLRLGAYEPPRGLVSPGFGTLLATGYYDRYREAFASAAE